LRVLFVVRHSLSWHTPQCLTSTRRQVRVLNEQFIELFDTDLVTIDQSRRPPWL
jgi:hypothetical protein